MVHADHDHLVRRMKELRGWADYIVESLTADQSYEQGKRELLEQVVDRHSLAELRELAGKLRARFDLLLANLDVRRAAG